MTTADSFALRENHMGTVMLRGEYLCDKGVLSPKLADAPSADGCNLDLGSTNHRNRYLVALSTQFFARVSSQTLVDIRKAAVRPQWAST